MSSRPAIDNLKAHNLSGFHDFVIAEINSNQAIIVHARALLLSVHVAAAAPSAGEIVKILQYKRLRKEF